MECCDILRAVDHGRRYCAAATGRCYVEWLGSAVVPGWSATCLASGSDIYLGLDVKNGSFVKHD